MEHLLRLFGVEGEWTPYLNYIAPLIIAALGLYRLVVRLRTPAELSSLGTALLYRLRLEERSGPGEDFVVRPAANDVSFANQFTILTKRYKAYKAGVYQGSEPIGYFLTRADRSALHREATRILREKGPYVRASTINNLINDTK